MSNPKHTKTLRSLVEAANMIGEDRKWSIGLYDFHLQTRSPRLLYVRKEHDIFGTQVFRIPSDRTPEEFAKEYAEKHSKGYRRDANGKWLLFQHPNSNRVSRLITLPDWSIEKPKRLNP